MLKFQCSTLSAALVCAVCVLHLAFTASADEHKAPLIIAHR